MTAYPTAYPVLVDGKQVEFQIYAIQNAAGNDVNYLKLGDVAQALGGAL